MEKSHILDILSDIKTINNAFESFGKAESYKEFCDLAIAMTESLITVEAFWETYDSGSDWIGTEIYQEYSNDIYTDQNENGTVRLFIMLDYECWYSESTNNFVLNRCGYAIGIDGQIYEDIDDVISFINSLEGIVSHKDGSNE